MLATLTLMAWMASGLVVQGSTDCPNPTEVAEQLKPLLPEEFAHPERVLLLSIEKDQVVLALTSEGGNVLAKRELPRKGSCASQAKRAAVVAAAWQAELDDEPVPPPPKIEQEVPQVQAAPLPPTPPPTRSSDLHFEMGLRAIASPGPSFQLELGIGKSWGRWGIQGNIEGGKVEGPSIAVLLGPTFFLLQGYPTMSLRAQGVVALGTSSPDTPTAAPGTEVGIRVTMGASGARGFVDLAYVHYFYGETPPQNQGIVTVGFAFGGAG